MEREVRPSGAWPDRLAPIMFWLAFVYLLAVAGVIHRADLVVWANEPVREHLGVEDPAITGFELSVLALTLAFLWPVFVAEVILGLLMRDKSMRLWPSIVRAVLVIVFPPVRMGLLHPANGMIWLPRLGWHTPGKQLLAYLDKRTGNIMLVFAALILPLLAIQFSAANLVEEYASLKLAVDIATAAIWVAFATEFIIKGSIAPAFFKYAKSRWLDAAIVILPTIEFLLSSWAGAAPAMRLLRLQKVVTPQYLARMGRLYRLRGVLTKGWQALLALEGFARLLGQTPEKRLRVIEDQIADLEETVANLRAEAEEIRKRIQAKAAEDAQEIAEKNS